MLETLGPFNCSWGRHEAAVNTAHERVCPQPVGTVNRIVALTCCEQSRNTRSLVVVNPQSSHRIMHAGEDSHGNVPRIIAYKHFIYFEDCAELAIQNICGNVRHIQVHLVLAADTHPFETDLEYFSGSDVTRDEVSIGWILFFEEVPALAFRNR